MKRFALAPLLVLQLASGAEPIQFNPQIRPILQQNCVVCHNHGVLDKPAISGGLALDSYDAVMRGSKRRIVIVGDAAGSELVRRLESADLQARMPKGGDALNIEAIGIIRQWIADGAKEGSPIGPMPVSDHGVRRRISLQPIDVFIPFGARRPREAPPARQSAPPLVLGIPGSLTIDEEGPVEKVAVQLHGRGIVVRIGPLAPITAMAFTPDGKSLLMGSQGLVAVWDLQTRQVVRELEGIAGNVNSVVFSPDGKLLSVAGGKPFASGEISLFDSQSLRPVAKLSAHKEIILNQAFSPDSKRLATVSYDKTAEVWDLKSRQRIAAIKDHSDPIYCVAFDRQGKTLATTGSDRIVKLSEAATGKGLITINPEQKSMFTLAFSPDGKYLVTAGESPEMRWWEVANMTDTVSERGWIPARKFAGHTAPVNDMKFSPDGNLLASAGADHTIRFWDARTGEPLRTLVDADDLLYSLAFSPDSKRLAAGSGDGLTRVWDVKTGDLLMVLVQKHGEWLVVDPAGQYEASANWRPLVRARKGEHAKNN